jgi:hypothetical protein
MKPKKLTRKRLALLEKDRRHRRVKILFPVLLGILILFVLRFTIEDFFLLRFGVCHKGVVTQEREFFRGKRRTHELMFVVNSKTYYGDSGIRENMERVGDTVAIVYLPVYPRINRTVSRLDEKFPCVKE